MAGIETHSPEAAYATKENIVVPKVQNASAIAARAKVHIEQRLAGSTAGKTLNSAPTLKQES